MTGARRRLLLSSVLSMPGTAPRGPDMQKIWVNLRAPSRDNPSPPGMGGSILMALMVFGVAVLILIAAGVIVWLILR